MVERVVKMQLTYGNPAGFSKQRWFAIAIVYLCIVTLDFLVISHLSTNQAQPS